MSMVESPSKDVKTRDKDDEGDRPRYRVTPRYSAMLGDGKFVIQVALPGVSKDKIQMKALEDYFTLRAERDNIVYSLDLDLNFKIEPSQVTSKYSEGLLRVEFERYDPLKHAYTVPIS